MWFLWPFYTYSAYFVENLNLLKYALPFNSRHAGFIYSNFVDNVCPQLLLAEEAFQNLEEKLMKKRTLTILLVTLVIILLFAVGCNNQETAENVEQPEIEVAEAPEPTPEVILVNETEDKMFFEVEIPVNEEEISEAEL